MNTKSPSYVLFFITIICVVFGVGVSVVNYATQGLLAQNEALQRNRVVARAFMLDVEGKSPAAYEKAVEANIAYQEIKDGDRTWKVYKKGDDAIGFVVSGMGFWDRITALLVLTPDMEKVLNIQFFGQKETPGLGARIEDPWFTDQFKDLQIAWDNPKDSRIIVGASPDPNAQNRVDAITGATQTSMALMNFLNEELARIKNLKPETWNLTPGHG